MFFVNLTPLYHLCFNKFYPENISLCTNFSFFYMITCIDIFHSLYSIQHSYDSVINQSLYYFGVKLFLNLIVPLVSCNRLFWGKEWTVSVTPQSWQQLVKRKSLSCIALASVHFTVIIISQKSIAIKMTSTGTTITIICTKYCLQLY